MENRRRRRLVTGQCDECTNNADIPWKGKKLCYWCWNDLMETRKKELPNGWWLNNVARG